MNKVYQITETEYHDNMDVLPPIMLGNGVFQVSEPYDHKQGLPTYATYIHLNDEYFSVGNLTTREAKAWEDMRSIEAENFSEAFQAEEEYEGLHDHEKIQVAFMQDQHGYTLAEALEENWEEITIIEASNEKELGEYVVDNGLMGTEIPETLAHFIDYEAIGRDWAIEYSEFVHEGTTYYGYMG